MSKLNYPKHSHPHGAGETPPSDFRLWVCEECGHIFTDEEIRNGIKKGWGHPCKSHPCHKGQRCESHLEPYLPDVCRTGIDEEYFGAKN
jgi:hypothetical protein